MEHQIKLALVGRPNVGKSALFNRICKKRISIVDEAEGITRDRLYGDADFFGKPFTVIDTGGIDPHGEGDFHEEIIRQAEIAIEEADSLVMVVDGQVGVTALDLEVAKVLLRTKKPLTLAVNKIDSPMQESLVGEFYRLGITDIVPVSATQNNQIAELLEAALDHLEFPENEETEPDGIRLAIIGRPNVGKSTLINTLLNEERCVVSPIAGTTRDSIDAVVEMGDQRFTLIDTAGIRRKQKEREVVDKFAAIRTERAIERADVCLLILDATEGMTAQEKRIASHIEESGKGCILLFNKWDLVKGVRMEHCLRRVREELGFLEHCPAYFISAKNGRNLKEIYPAAIEVFENLSQRIPTGELNRFLERAMQKYHPPMIQGKRLRIYYMAQVAAHPPHFVLFVNRPDLMLDSYKKYLINSFRKAYAFTGVPLIFSLRGKVQREIKSASSVATVADPI